MHHRILVALDGSKESEKALHMAIHVAQMEKATLRAIHVVRLPDAPSSRAEIDHRLERTEDETRVILHEAKRLAKEAGVTCEADLVFGHPAEQILHAAKQHDCDLIVIGRRGLSGIRRFHLGSVSEVVARHSEVDVVIVKHDPDAPQGGGDA